MDEFRARRVVDSLRDRGVNARLRGTTTPQQKALIAELRAADYPATWKLSASAADDKLVTSGAQIQTSAPG